MRVFDLRCDSGHVFEGWFASDEDYQSQRTRGILQCPMCESLQVEKTLSAPHLNAKSNTKSVPTPAHHQRPKEAKVSDRGQSSSSSSSVSSTASHPPQTENSARADWHAQWLAHARTVLAQGEDVGSGFAEEAKRMHEGQTPARLIHGQASLEEVVDLLEEGVAVLPLPPEAKEPLQ